MSEKRRDPVADRTKSKSKRPPVRSNSGNWWPYAIAGGVVVLVAAFIAVTQLGHPASGGNGGGGLAVGSPVPTDSVPSSDGRTVSLTDFHGSKVVVYFYEGGG